MEKGRILYIKERRPDDMVRLYSNSIRDGGAGVDKTRRLAAARAACGSGRYSGSVKLDRSIRWTVDPKATRESTYFASNTQSLLRGSQVPR